MARWSARGYSGMQVSASIPLRAGGSYNRPNQPVDVLDRVVRMVPRRSLLGGVEPAHERVPGSNGTLRKTVDAVHVHAESLTKAVSVGAGAVALELVDHGDLDRAPPPPPACLDLGPRILGTTASIKLLALNQLIDKPQAARQAHPFR